VGGGGLHQNTVYLGVCQEVSTIRKVDENFQNFETVNTLYIEIRCCLLKVRCSNFLKKNHVPLHGIFQKSAFLVGGRGFILWRGVLTMGGWEGSYYDIYLVTAEKNSRLQKN
jgi:hypothetical protein